MRKVQCRFCGRWQNDHGINQTCENCGACPVESYDYRPDQMTHPEYKHGKPNQVKGRIKPKPREFGEPKLPL